MTPTNAPALNTKSRTSLIQVTESKKPSTQNNPLPNYRNVPPPNQHILMIDTGSTEEQVLNSFVDIKPILPT